MALRADRRLLERHAVHGGHRAISSGQIPAIVMVRWMELREGLQDMRRGPGYS